MQSILEMHKVFLSLSLLPAWSWVVSAQIQLAISEPGKVCKAAMASTSLCASGLQGQMQHIVTSLAGERVTLL